MRPPFAVVVLAVMVASATAHDHDHNHDHGHEHHDGSAHKCVHEEHSRLHGPPSATRVSYGTLSDREHGRRLANKDQVKPLRIAVRFHDTDTGKIATEYVYLGGVI